MAELRVAVLTVSDRSAAGAREDRGGPAVAEAAARLGWRVLERGVVPDERAAIAERLRAWRGAVDVILTTGGTGLGPRDITPEATLAVCEKVIPGLGELMREKGRQANPRAALSRAVGGALGPTLVVNLPGSPKGAVESLEAVAALLPHAAAMLAGGDH